MTENSSVDLVAHKLRTLIRTKATDATPGSPEHYRLQELLELSDDALIDTVYNNTDPNPDRIGCPPHEALQALAVRSRSLSDPLWDHVMECAPCRIEVRDLARHQPVRSERAAARALRWWLVAVVAIGLGVCAWILTHG